MKYKISPLGDTALIIEFGNQISVEINNRVLQLSEFIEKNPFQGLIETVPAYSSLTLFYKIAVVRDNFAEFPTAFDAVKNFVETALKNLDKEIEYKSRLIKIPVYFDKESALDLEFVASINNLLPAQVIEIFLSKTYRVFMLGFLPGFSYMGEIDERIAAPRKSAPRLKVARGSVGIAGRQTGIYSLASPGGWQIIGRTSINLFTPNKKTPTFLQAGDTVQFYKEN